MNTVKMKRLDVPLGNLVRHIRNVRQVEADEEATASLVASIRAHGLLNPLVVEGSEERASVIAGGRRLAALQSIAATGGLPPDHPVPCVLVSGGGDSPLGERLAIEISLAENSGRMRMHAVDEAAAFGALGDAGVTDRELAERFGRSPRTVQRRLRLNRAAPELLARCRRGELTLGVVEAATVHPDPELQIRAVEDTTGRPFGRAHAVRTLLTGEMVPLGSALAQLAGGLEAYEAEGGKWTRDLLDRRKQDDENILLLDRALAEGLALVRLEELALAERERGWTRVRTALHPPADWWEDRNQMSAQTPDDLPADCVGGAEVHLHPGWDSLDSMNSGRKPFRRLVLVPARTKTPDADAGPGRRSKLDRDLDVMRLSIERSWLADDPLLARDMLLCGLLGDLTDLGDPGIGLVLQAAPQRDAAREVKDVPECVTAADAALAGRMNRLLEPLREASDDRARWHALRAMPGADKARLLACCVARMLGTPAPTGPRPARAAALGELGIPWDVAFRTDAAVLGRLPKAELMRIARERLDPEDIDLHGLNALPKKELVEAVAAAFALHRERHSGRSPWIPDAIAGRGGGSEAA